MSYRLKQKEKVGPGMQRIAAEQADKALAQLSANHSNRDDAIHEIRVCFKKIRAILRLMQSRGGSNFLRESVFYRDLGRKLSAVRNDVAMLESLAKLKQQFSDQLSANALRKIRRPLEVSNQSEDHDKIRALQEVGRALRTGRRRIQKWKLGKGGFRGLAGGLRLTFQQGRDRFSRANKLRTVESLHEWRKRVKDLWYQLRILKEIWPGEVGNFADDLERLGDFLSDHHDLALLRESSVRNSKEIGDERELETLIALIDQRIAELRRSAKILGERIYAEKPTVFVDRLRHYWHAWREEASSPRASLEAGNRAASG